MQKCVLIRNVLKYIYIYIFPHQLRYDGTSDLATVESYDPITNSWQPEVSMGTRRSCLGVAVLHGLLYAAGGYDGASCLNRYLRTDTMTVKDILSSFVKMSLVESHLYLLLEKMYLYKIYIFILMRF